MNSRSGDAGDPRRGERNPSVAPRRADDDPGTGGRGRRAPRPQPPADRDPRPARDARPDRPEPARGRAGGQESRASRPVPAPAPGRTLTAPRPRTESGPGRPRKVVSQRGRRTKRDSGARINVKRRTKVALVVVMALLAIAMGRLVTIQTIDSKSLAATGLLQNQHKYVLRSERGSITDRNGAPLAFSVEGRAIATRPADFENDSQRSRVADILVAGLGPSVTKADLMTKLKSKKGYVYLARNVMPAMADSIMAKIAPVLVDKKVGQKAQDKLANAVATEVQDIRTEPDGALAESVVGSTGWNGLTQTTFGQAGIESKFNDLLSGRNGSRLVQVDSAGIAIPNTTTDVVPAVDGTGIKLTLDQDLQYSLDQQLMAQVNASNAKGGCAIVKGISDGQIYAMDCYQPGKSVADTEKLAITTFEPGSVNKVVTFAAALDRGLITPTTVLSVDGQISIGGREIHDAWVHSPINMTATGILAKSSNVGTLMIAQKIGPTVFAQELARYGLGKKTGIELPGESAGSYPAQSQWSATSFANLPIGQGVSMTLLQLVDMYQAIGNKGVMVSPTIIAGTTRNGVYTPSKVRATSQVMKASTASTLLDMLRGTVQGGDYFHKGTGTAAAITGYQVAGKTGTAQQIDPATKAYSQTLTTATFAGIVPADNPKFAIAIMIDAPVNGSEGGDSAAPLFHKIASYALREADVAPSATVAPIYDLYVQP